MPDPEVTPMAAPEPPSPSSTPEMAPPEVQSAPPTTAHFPPPAAPAPPPQQKPGEMFKNLSHSFMGAVLGTMAGREKTTGYTTDETGKQTPVTTHMTSGDQLRQIARSALLGLAAGANAPKQKSGMASALGGLGAGAESAVEQGKQDDQKMRKQSADDFDRSQKVLLNKAANAHIAVQTMHLVQEMRNSNLESQSKVAALGQDTLDAAIAGGNRVVAQDVHMDDLMKAKQDHPEYLDYTPVLTKTLPKEGADPNDPDAVDRFYSLVDLTKPVAMTPMMIGHLKAVGFPGAENLKPGQSVGPKEFQGTWYQGLKMYNAALLDPKNKDVIDVTDANGNTMKAVYNKTLNTTEILRDPDTGKPLGGKVETMTSRIKGADGKTYDVLFTKSGQRIKTLGEAGTAADNSTFQTLGDYGKSGEAYLATVPQPFQNDVKMIGKYDMEPAALGRGGAMRGAIMSAVGQYNDKWSEREYKTRYDYLKGYQNSANGDGAARSRINTALGHLDMLGQAAPGIAKNDYRALNQLANEYGIQADRPGPVLYNLVAEKAATEAAAATGSNTKEEIERQRKNLSIDAGPIQQREQIAGNIALLKTQAETVENNFKQAMGGQSSDELGRPVIYPQNKPILDKWSLKSNPQSGPPPGMVHVQIPGAAPGYVPKEKLAEFQQKHPNAQVVQ